jgi:hypothetical protein
MVECFLSVSRLADSVKCSSPSSPSADYDTVPEVEWFCQRIEAAVQELAELARVPPIDATAREPAV